MAQNISSTQKRIKPNIFTFLQSQLQSSAITEVIINTELHNKIQTLQEKVPSFTQLSNELLDVVLVLPI